MKKISSVNFWKNGGDLLWNQWQSMIAKSKIIIFPDKTII